ncbi:MAG TPA: prepilin peptidase [Candidatus Saccharimonadia bacterium]|nr:prepilin peptidase [Candidatus Saccharimonadia bacterium]
MLLIAYCTLLGLVIGSAINAVVWRLYVGRSWVRGRSRCPECSHQLAAKDLVPVLSWVLLLGRCRYCRARIHWQYPVVEALTAALFGLSAAILMPPTLGAGVLFGLWLAILTMLIILAVYDLRWMLLPDKVMLPTIALGAVYVAAAALLHHSWWMAAGPLMAAVVAGGTFYALVAFSRGRAMGGGDIKLAFVMGLLLGLRGTAVALLIAFNTAAIFGLVLIATRRRRLRGTRIAFGPFLVAGTIVAFWWGHALVEWYLRLNGLG